MVKRKALSDIASFFKRSRTEEPLASTSSVESSGASLPSVISSTKQRKSGIDDSWKKDFPWLIENGEGTGMLCSLCQKHQRRPKKCIPGRAVWVDIACTSLRRQSCVNHKDSDNHKEAVVFEATKAAATERGIEAGFIRERDVNREAMKTSMMLLYFLVKEEMPHHTKFKPLLEMVKDLGIDKLNLLDLGKNAHYTSNRHIHEVTLMFGDHIWEQLKSEILNSPWYAVMVDETTDISTTSQLTLYIRYLWEGRSKTVYCTMVEMPNGKADTIRGAITKFLGDNSIPLQRMCAFGSDGASVMLGRKAGVSTQLQGLVPHLLSNHCVAHRLALASAQAAEKVTYLGRFKGVIEQLYRFYSWSGVRTASLKEIQSVLNEPVIKITEAKDVRWLSHSRAVNAVRVCLPAIITSLEYEATEKGDAQAQGLAIFVQRYEFVAALMLMSDVLPVLAKLSQAMQSLNHNIADQVLPEEKHHQPPDKLTGAAICIQKNWRGYKGRQLYVEKLYDKFEAEEKRQHKKILYQMEEGELLVENHTLEVLLDDGQTTRRNAKRRYLSQVITLQRAWRKYLQRHKNQSVESTDTNNSNSIQATNAIRSRSPTVEDKSVLKDSVISVNFRETDTDFHSDDETVNAFVNPLACDDLDENETVPVASTFVNPLSAGSFIDVEQSQGLTKQPYEDDEEFFRRQRKVSLLAKAHEFVRLKQSNANALPLDLHLRSSEGQDSDVLDLDRREPMSGSDAQEESPEITTNMCNCDDNSCSHVGSAALECCDGDDGGDSCVQGQQEGLVTKGGNACACGETKGGNSDECEETKGDNSESSPEEELSAFDVYNIETALPDIDWKTLEHTLKAASEEARLIQEARRNDREEIRKKLAMGGDEDYYDDNDDDDDITYKKPNLQSRLHSGLQICFMNESPCDTDSEGLSPRQHEIHDNLKSSVKDNEVDSDNNLRSVTDLNSLAAAKADSVNHTGPPLLKTTMDGVTSENFHSRQEQLQQEAKMALAQAGSMAHMQLEIEKQTQKKSPMAEMVGIPGLGERRRKKLGVRKLQEMNLTSIQVLYNDLQTQIENLNEELVHLLMERDELHMEQDSMLVDIEDLTRRAEELAARKNYKDSKSNVKGKVSGR